jgi:Cu-processing system ATP-binding protein
MIPEAAPVIGEATPMIRFHALRKSFGRREVLKGVDLHIPRGRVTALVGPNASGKTTLIKTVLGLVRPDGGRVEVGGRVLEGDWRYRERIGYMAQDAPLPENLSAAELFRMLGDLRGVEFNGAVTPAAPAARAAPSGPSGEGAGAIGSAGAAPESLPVTPPRAPPGADEGPDPQLLDAFGLARELNKPLRTLSGGTRQKVNAVLAFLFDPELLILDEPTAGLDPVASGILKDRILRERAAGKTFLITSHILPEVEELAEEVAFLVEGQVRFTGTLQELLERTGQERLERAVADLMRAASEAVPKPPSRAAGAGPGRADLPELDESIKSRGVVAGT